MSPDLKKQSWSIIVFCYNEEKTLQKLVEDLQIVLKKISNGQNEIIIVDDGSKDQSLKIARALAKDHRNIRIIEHPLNLGIGSALRSGYQNARFENVCAVPADAQFNVFELLPFGEIPPKTVVSFYRETNTSYTWFRHFLSLVNRVLNRYFLKMNLKDVNWIKIYKNEDLKKLNLRLTSLLVESEISSKLLKTGSLLKEVPSIYLKRRDGKSKALSRKIIYQAARDAVQFFGGPFMGKNLLLFFLVPLFLLSRLLPLFFSIDRFFFFEELHTGTVTWDLMHGLQFPLLNYQDMYHSGETLFLGFLGVPFFRILGPSLLSLKLVVLTLHLAAYCLLLFFLNRYFGRPSALFAGLLFIFAPPLWIWTNLRPMYQHSEAFFFLILGLCFLFQYLFSGRPRRSSLVFLGLVSGIGLWYSLSFSIMILATLIFWGRVERKSLFSRRFFLYAVSLIIGFAPRLYHLYLDSSVVFYVEGKSLIHYFLDPSLLSSLKRFFHLVFVDFPQSFSFESFAVSLLYFAIFILSFLGLCLMICLRDLFFLIYLLLFLAALGFGHFPIERNPDGFRYLAPLFPFVFIIIALFLQKLLERKTRGHKVFAALLGLPLLAIGFVSYIHFVFLGWPASSGNGLQYAGYSRKAFDWLYGVKIAGAAIHKSEILRAAGKEGHTRYFYEQILPVAIAYGMKVEDAVSLIEEGGNKGHLYYGGLGRLGNLALAERIPKKYHPYFYENLGSISGEGVWQQIGFWSETKKIITDHVRKTAMMEKEIPEEYRDLFYEGFGRGLSLIFSGDPKLYNTLADSMGASRKGAFCAGLGRMIGWLYKNPTEEKIRIIDHVEGPLRPYFYEGWGIESAYDLWSTLASHDEWVALIEKIPSFHWEDFLRGIGIGMKRIFVDDPRGYENRDHEP